MKVCTSVNNDLDVDIYFCHISNLSGIGAQGRCAGIFKEGIIFMSFYCLRGTEYVKVKN